MKLLKQLLETGDLEIKMSPERAIELLNKRKAALERKQESLNSTPPFTKLMPDKTTNQSGHSMLTHGQDWVDIRRASNIREANRWAKMITNWADTTPNTFNLLIDVYSNPHSYFIVPGEGMVNVIEGHPPVPTICVANKEVMATVGLDEGDFLYYINIKQLEYDVAIKIGQLNRRINQLKQDLDSKKHHETT